MLKLPVKQEKISLKKIFAGLLVLLFTVASPVHAVRTSLFYGGKVVSLDQPEVEIGAIYGLRLYPANDTVATADKSVYFRHTVRNLSNTTNKIIISITYATQALPWTAQLVKDENGDGVHQDWENTPLEPEQVLGEGAIIHFFVKLTRPDSASPGDVGSAIVKAACTVKDGDSYVGYDGVTYGGPDEAETTDTVVVK